MEKEKRNTADIEIIDFPAEDYQPLKDYEGWRVAVLRSCENTRLEKIHWMQKHMQTDEVFVLISGQCRLILAGDGDQPENYKAVEMEPYRLYNIRKGIWHNHILDSKGAVLIVENQNTTDDNSPTWEMSEDEIRALCACVRGFEE